MQRFRSRQPISFAVVMLVQLVVSAPQASAQCVVVGCATSLTDLGTLPAHIASSAFAVSDHGIVAGYSSKFSDPSFNRSAVHWTDGAMKDLGNLPGSISAYSAGISGDGSIIVGTSLSSPGSRAFRWTASTGMQDLGIISTASIAAAISNNGQVVVGTFLDGSSQRAFRWTSSGGAQNLGLALNFREAGALAVNADGSVVVGFANVTTGGGTTRGFRWTEVDGMRNLSTLTGDFGRSIAQAVSGDGQVIVGFSSYAGADTQTHAVKWTSVGITDLGTLPGGNHSAANGVNSDGSIVVGLSTTAGVSSPHAFRWTPTGGMKDLNALLSSAGVNMNGIVLTAAHAVSGNGQYIVGSAQFGISQRAFLVRYLEVPNSEPTELNEGNFTTIAGTTETASVQRSIDELSNARRSAAVHQHGFAAPLLAADKPMRQSNDVAAFGSVGSRAAGAAARYALGDGFAILGGLSYSQEDYQSVEMRHATTGALALRYTYSGFGAWQPFIEGGGWVSPHASMRFARTYANGAGLATGVGSTDGTIAYVFGRAGVVVDLDRRNQFSLSSEYGRERMTIRGYAEPLSSTNPFEARVPDSTDTFDMLKAKAQYSINLSARIDTTLWAAAVRSFIQTSGLTVAVAGIGTLSPSSNPGTTWAEYGARVGYKLTDTLTFDVFSGGISGRNGIGTHVHSGIGVRVQF